MESILTTKVLEGWDQGRMTKNVNFECIIWQRMASIFIMNKIFSNCPSNKCWNNRFWNNASHKFLYFVGNVPDEKTGKVSTRINGRQYFR